MEDCTRAGRLVTTSSRSLAAAAFAVSLAMPVVAGTNPPVTGGLTARYVGSSVTLYGSDVIVWADSATGDGAQDWLSGGSHGGGHCPSWVNDGTGPNGQPYLFFDKADWDWLVYDDLWDMNIHTSFTIAFVIRPQRYSETGTETGVVFSDFGATGNQQVRLEISADNTTWNAMVRDGASPRVELSVSCARAPYREDWSVLTLRWDSAADTLALYENGELRDSATDASFDSATEWGNPDDWAQAHLGSLAHYSKDLAHMSLVEVLMYDRSLNEDELGQLHDYLKSKYWPSGPEPRARVPQEQGGRRPFLATGASPEEPPHSVLLVSEGRTRYSIVLGDSAVEPERTAAEELARYLRKSTGALFPVVRESKREVGRPALYLGWTHFARRHDVEPETLGTDEFVVRSAAEDLVLCGSRPRGTLYAVGEFLERFCGIRWLTAYGEEHVPPKRRLAIPSVSIREKPAFVVRDMMPGGAGDRAFTFLRLNGHAAALHRGHVSLPTAKWGGMHERWRGPWLAHTLHGYLPPTQYFKSNPEYFGLVDGERLEDAQICLTSEEVRRVFLARLRDRIEADGEGIYSISCMEHLKQCRCQDCQALMAREGTVAAPLIDFVNYLADSIRGKYPNVVLETLAYNMTFVPPETMKVADDVIVRLAHLNRHFFEPMTSPLNKGGAECWHGWRKAAKQLALWGYPAYFFPQPNMGQVYSEDLRFYKSLGVTRVFYQYAPAGERWTHGLVDLRHWLIAKLLWNPEQDPRALMEDFCNHYYGPAGPFVIRYVDLLDDAYSRSDRHAVHFNAPDALARFRRDYRTGRYPTCLSMWMEPLRFTTYRFLDRDFLAAAHELFRQAEDQVKEEPGLLARARRARLSLDRITLRLLNRLAEEYGRSQGTLDEFPLDRAEIGTRYLDTMSRDRFGRPTREHERTVKFLESTKQADSDQCDWLRGYRPEFFK